MTVWFWKVYDKRLVEACFLPVITLGVVTVAAVVLPQGSGAESAMESIAFFTTLVLIVAKALTRPLNIVVPALVIVAGVFLAQWLFLVAPLLYLALVLISYFDGAESHRAAEAGRSSGPR